MKEKTVIGNNYRRIECNLDISERTPNNTVKKFCTMLGFRPNFSIYKRSAIYWFDNFNTVYYIVYQDDTLQKEIGRFVEIEMSETYEWSSPDEAWELLLDVERQLTSIGITARRRVKKSLFETFLGAGLAFLGTDRPPKTTTAADSLDTSDKAIDALFQSISL